jgi:hypothetical protein
MKSKKINGTILRENPILYIRAALVFDPADAHTSLAHDPAVAHHVSQIRSHHHHPFDRRHPLTSFYDAPLPQP